MKQNNNETGLAHIAAIVLVIVAVAAVAFGGWWVWAKNQETTDSKQAQSQEVSSDPSEGGKYLVIEEWGVRFELPEELRGDIYYKVASNDLLKADFASFASNKLDLLVGDDSCTFKNNPSNDGISARLGRGLHENLVSNPEDIRNQRQLIKNLGDTDYFYTKETKSPPITCLTGQHDQFSSVEKTISDQLNQAFVSLEEYW